MRSCRSRSLVSRAVYMSCMLPTLSWMFIEAGASLVGQLAVVGAAGGRLVLSAGSGAGGLSGSSARPERPRAPV